MGQWVMGHSFDGSHGSWVTARDPFGALGLIDLKIDIGAHLGVWVCSSAIQFLYGYSGMDISLDITSMWSEPFSEG